jgi:dihydrofolate reductase
MGKVIAGFAMSLDGFIADTHDGVHALFGWLGGGDTPVSLPNSERVFMTSAASAAHYQNFLSRLGSHITGRRDFDVSRAWGGSNPLGVPMFIVSHSVPQEWSGEDAPFTFVTEGVEAALALAQADAGDKVVAISGSHITQQLLNAGLLDELHIDLVPVLLGDGIRLFERLENAPTEMEIMSVVAAPGVTHLKYRVIKAA